MSFSRFHFSDALSASIVAALAATALQALTVPFGTAIGTVAGTIVAFLAFSYRFYGR